MRRGHCAGKVQHRTREGANTHARHLEQHLDEQPFFRDVYECKDCGFFHVGRMTNQTPQFNNRQWIAAHFGSRRNVPAQSGLQDGSAPK